MAEGKTLCNDRPSTDDRLPSPVFIVLMARDYPNLAAILSNLQGDKSLSTIDYRIDSDQHDFLDYISRCGGPAPGFPNPIRLRRSKLWHPQAGISLFPASLPDSLLNGPAMGAAGFVR